jgi:hypothetical protein
MLRRKPEFKNDKKQFAVWTFTSDETQSFGASWSVAYATIVAKMSRCHEIGTTVAIGLATLATLGLLLLQ